jgi:cell division protein FtsB
LNLLLKPILRRTVKYVKLTILVSLVATAGVLMGQKGLVQKRHLEQKQILLEKENELLTVEIQSLERKVTLLRADPKTIEKVAKRKLGMARPDERVYIFERTD